MVQSFIREKKIFCGDHYREVDIFGYTTAQKNAAARGKRSKKVQESEPKQKNLNDKNARRYFVQLGNMNFGSDPDALHVTATYSPKYIAAKAGLLIAAVILPYSVVNEKFVNRLEEVARESRRVLNDQPPVRIGIDAEQWNLFAEQQEGGESGVDSPSTER